MLSGPSAGHFCSADPYLFYHSVGLQFVAACFGCGQNSFDLADAVVDLVGFAVVSSHSGLADPLNKQTIISNRLGIPFQKPQLCGDDILQSSQLSCYRVLK